MLQARATSIVPLNQQDGYTRVRKSRTVVSAVLLALGVSRSFASNGAELPCDPLAADQPALFEAVVDISLAAPFSREARVPARSQLLVIAREMGIDATVEVRDNGHLMGRSVSPINQTGVARLAIKPPDTGTLSLKITAAAKDAKAGKISVRAISISPDRLDERCIRLQFRLAAADQTYAEGHIVKFGTPSGDGHTDAASAYQSAADQYLSVVRDLQPSPPSVWLADAQHALAVTLYNGPQEWASAQSWAHQAAATYEQLHDEYGHARAQALEAAAAMEAALTAPPDTHGGHQHSVESLQQARELLTSVVNFHARRHELLDQALAQDNMGLAYYYEGRNAAAIEAYRGALGLFDQLDDARWRKITLQNIALADYELGRVNEAIAEYERVIQLFSADEDPLVAASVLNNSAIANRVSGNLDVALQRYTRALELEEKAQNRREQARSLHGIGAVYETLGDSELALDFYRQALALVPGKLDARGRTASLRSLGNVLRSQGNAAEALAAHQEALSLASTPATRAQIRIQLARDLETLGRHEEALKELNALIDDPSAGGAVVRAQARLERGQLSAPSRTVEAELGSAIQTLHQADDPIDEFAGWLALARVQARRHATTAALRSLGHALTLAEEVRQQSANPELRAGLLQPLRPGFDLKIALLEQLDARSANPTATIDRHRLAMLALLTAEKARSRALEDFERFDLSAPGMESQLLEQRRALYRELAARHALLDARRDRYGDEDPKVREIRVDIGTLRAQLAQIEARISTSTTHTQRSAPDEAALRLDRIPPDTALVEYWLGTSGALAWVLTHDHLQMIPLGDSTAITSAAEAFYTALKGFGSVDETVRLETGRRLSALVLDPIAPAINGKHHLIFAPDGALYYIPFAALMPNDPGHARFLIESDDIVTTPSVRPLLTTDARHPTQIDTAGMLLVADPVYSRDDERFPAQPPRRATQSASADTGPRLFRGGSRGESLSRLVGTAREAGLIQSLRPPQLEVLEGFTATKSRFLSSRLDHYRVIHVASHATLDAQIPGLSALILSTVDSSGAEIDGRVLAADLATRRINADLVVLSACDTALGKNIPGEGLMGLQYVVQARGARSIISSLWEVPDEAAAQVMGSFYRAYLSRTLPVGTALSEAMRQMLEGGLEDPGQWAAFTASVSDPGWPAITQR